MSNTPAMFRPFLRYAEFNGRSNRVEFWSFVLLMYLVAGAFGGLMYLISLKDGHFDIDTFFPNYIRWSQLYSLFSLGTLVPYIAVAVRRLHDSGRTGWWLIVPVIISVVGYVAFFIFQGEAFINAVLEMGPKMEAMQQDNPMTAMTNPAEILKLEWPIFKLMIPWMVVPSIAGQLLIVIFMLLPGTPGDNRFGPPPARG